MIKLLICGSRNFNNYEVLKKSILSLGLSMKYVMILSGAARGADTLAIQFAEELGLQYKLFPALWEKYGRSAGMIRNSQMIELATATVAFWDGKSVGTKDAIEKTKQAGKLVYVFDFYGNRI